MNFRRRKKQILGEKDKIDILLHEYDTLRAEMLERHTVLIQSVGFAVIVLGAMLAVLWEHWEFCIAILLVASGLFLLGWWRVDLDTAGLALRVCELEKQINELAGEPLLEWEGRWGLFAPEFHLRDSKVSAARRALRKTSRSAEFPALNDMRAAAEKKRYGHGGWLTSLSYLRDQGLHAIKLTARLFQRDNAALTIPWLLCFLLASTVVALLIVNRNITTDLPTSDDNRPWMDTKLSPDHRAELVVSQMTIDEKIQLTHGQLAQSIFPGFPVIYRAPSRSLGGAGFVPGISRLGIPDLQMVDAGSGVTVVPAYPGGGSTILPSPVALTASWNPQLAYKYGTIIGQESRAAGFNMVLGGAVNIAREPRSGRIFENHGEDPLLAGKMVSPVLRAIQDQHVIAGIKHFAVNDQETGRFGLSANLDSRSLRESDLLAFEIGIEDSGVGTVMCAYNRVNGIYSCENEELLSRTLKKQWGFKGWVLSDWGATHSTEGAAMAGLDQELPFDIHFGEALKRAVTGGLVPLARLNDMVRRILRTMFAVGTIDSPPQPQKIDASVGSAIAQQIEQEAIVLLKNSGGQLPLNAATTRSIAVIGLHADVGVLSGGGSSQITPLGGSAAPIERATSPIFDPIYLTAKKIVVPSSPLMAVRERAPNASVHFDPGTNIAAAKRLAASSDVVLLFASQWRSEGVDLPNLSLPGNQDALIDAVASSNPHTIVILQTGGAVLMPWLHKTSAVLEIWYPGIGGARAMADIIFGDVNPSGKLPISFPQSENDLPHRTIAKPTSSGTFYDMIVKPFLFRRDPSPPKFDVSYEEGLKVGYKWYDAAGIKPLFPFGFGLSYTDFRYEDFAVSTAGALHVTFSISNVGGRPGAEVAQVYLEMPANIGEPPKRLIAWKKVKLRPGERQAVDLAIDPKMLSIYNVTTDAWEIASGNYRVLVGSSSADIRLAGSLRLPVPQ